jgi:hypothetical protein
LFASPIRYGVSDTPNYNNVFSFTTLTGCKILYEIWWIFPGSLLVFWPMGSGFSLRVSSGLKTGILPLAQHTKPSQLNIDKFCPRYTLLHSNIAFVPGVTSSLPDVLNPAAYGSSYRDEAAMIAKIATVSLVSTDMLAYSFASKVSPSWDTASPKMEFMIALITSIGGRVRTALRLLLVSRKFCWCLIILQNLNPACSDDYQSLAASSFLSSVSNLCVGNLCCFPVCILPKRKYFFRHWQLNVQLM